MDVVKTMISLILFGLDKFLLQKIYPLFILFYLTDDHLVDSLDMTTIYVVLKWVVCQEIY